MVAGRYDSEAQRFLTLRDVQASVSQITQYWVACKLGKFSFVTAVCQSNAIQIIRAINALQINCWQRWAAKLSLSSLHNCVSVIYLLMKTGLADNRCYQIIVFQERSSMAPACPSRQTRLLQRNISIIIISIISIRSSSSRNTAAPA